MPSFFFSMQPCMTSFSPIAVMVKEMLVEMDGGLTCSMSTTSGMLDLEQLRLIVVWVKYLYYYKSLKDTFGIFQSQCLGVTWYMANDMQYFIISPLVFMPLFFFKTLGKTWSGIISEISILFCFC